MSSTPPHSPGHHSAGMPGNSEWPRLDERGVVSPLPADVCRALRGAAHQQAVRQALRGGPVQGGWAALLWPEEDHNRCDGPDLASFERLALRGALRAQGCWRPQRAARRRGAATRDEQTRAEWELRQAAQAGVLQARGLLGGLVLQSGRSGAWQEAQNWATLPDLQHLPQGPWTDESRAQLALLSLNLLTAHTPNCEPEAQALLDQAEQLRSQAEVDFPAHATLNHATLTLLWAPRGSAEARSAAGVLHGLIAHPAVGTLACRNLLAFSAQGRLALGPAGLIATLRAARRAHTLERAALRKSRAAARSALQA